MATRGSGEALQGQGVRRSSLLLVALAAMLGLVSVATLRAIQSANQEREPGRSRLVDLVIQRTDQIDEISAELTELQTGLDQKFDGVSSPLMRDLETARVEGGLSVRSGDAVVITLRDAPRTDAESGAACGLRICDLDLQRVVNVVWSAGATAVSINGERLTATSPIRQAGRTITVNFRPLLTPPYEVTALGANPDRVAEARDLVVLKSWADSAGIGVGVATVTNASVPPYGGSAELKFAEAGVVEDSVSP
jgi:uncharacterized protein YlxW (UPF0749 family)